MPNLILPPGVHGLPRAPKAAPMFDTAPHRNRGMHGIIAPIPGLPDDELIATAVSLGMVRAHAEQCRYSPQARFSLATVWCMVKDAAEGDKQAKQVLDRYRVGFKAAADNVAGEMLAAYEQEVDPKEMQRTMGLDA
jgi:hypothetical protein